MANTSKVYALIVGIDTYPTAPLSGCVSDAQKILAYLQQDPLLQVEPLTLLNDKATKAAIIDGFRAHLAKAKAGEAAFFYFSGHGAQEWADAVAWPNETDQRLETLAVINALLRKVAITVSFGEPLGAACLNRCEIEGRWRRLHGL